MYNFSVDYRSTSIVTLILYHFCRLQKYWFCNTIILYHFCRFNDFGGDGGPAARALHPKFNVFSKHVVLHAGVKLPPVEVPKLSLEDLRFLFHSFTCTLLFTDETLNCCFNCFEGSWESSFNSRKLFWSLSFGKWISGFFWKSLAVTQQFQIVIILFAFFHIDFASGACYSYIV